MPLPKIARCYVGTRYDETKVADVGLQRGPEGAGVLLMVRMERNVEVDGRQFNFPLNNEQFKRLQRLVLGFTSEDALDHLSDSIVRPHVVFGKPIPLR